MSDFVDKLLQRSSLTEEQSKEIRDTQQYLQQHNIQILFEELLAQVIQDLSSQPRKTILEGLKNWNNQHYFDRKDFETIFEEFDCFEEKTVKLDYLQKGLSIIGIEMEQEQIKTKYASYIEKGFIYQNEFVDILDKEYKEKLKNIL